jgi:hypothetical protein
MRFIQRLSVLAFAAVVALALFCQPQMRADAAMMMMDDPFPAGLELDCRVAGALGVEGEWEYDGDIWPELYDFPGWLNYWELKIYNRIYDRLPPGHRVICNVYIPPYSTDLELAREAADYAGYEWGEDETAEELANIAIELIDEGYWASIESGGNNP